jgi:hypothetical protein
MQGASFESAREEIGRDHAVRETMLPAGATPTRATTRK